MEAVDILTTDNCVILNQTFTTIDYYSPYTNRVYSESVYDIVNRNAQHDFDFIKNNIDHHLKFDLELAVSKEHCAIITQSIVQSSHSCTDTTDPITQVHLYYDRRDIDHIFIPLVLVHSSSL